VGCSFSPAPPERFSADARLLHPVDVVADYEKTIYDELDLLREAANASQLKRNFEGSPLLYVPQVYWDWCRPKVLVMERIYGVQVTDLATLADQRTNMKMLAERGVEIFFTQVFRDSFFHADMHPGNIFVSTLNPWSPQYIAIDCGIVGSLTPEDQDYLARNLFAFFKRDYRRVAQLHIDSGWVPAETKLNEFEAAIRTVCEPIFEKPLKDISFGQVLMRLFQTSRRFNMEVQPQLVLLQKTLLNIEGLGRQLYPDLDLWNTAQPFLERWMRERVSPKTCWATCRARWSNCRTCQHDPRPAGTHVPAPRQRPDAAVAHAQGRLVPASAGRRASGRRGDAGYRRAAESTGPLAGRHHGRRGCLSDRASVANPVIHCRKLPESKMKDWLDEIKWDSDGLVPAIAQDYKTGRVLMMAWMNREALSLTAAEQRAIYWSRSRGKLWRKGEESGHVQTLHEIRLDCDADVVILKVEQIGGIACHTGRHSCFYRVFENGEWKVVEPVLKDPHAIYSAGH